VVIADVIPGQLAEGVSVEPAFYGAATVRFMEGLESA
jgi:hypothetical protein